MSVLKRAGLYIIRKKYTTIFLFLFFLCLSSFIITGAVIVYDSSNTVAFLRKITGVSFQIVGNVTETVGSENQIDFTTHAVEIADIAFIQEMEVIDKFNLQQTIEIISLNVGFTVANNNHIDSGLAIANSKSELNEYFQKGYFKLIAGDHIEEDEKEKVIISKQLAEENELSIGDRIELLTYNNGESTEETITVGVVGGIFEPIEGINDIISNTVAAENMIFIGKSFVSGNAHLKEPNYDVATFFLKDPDDFEYTIGEVSKVIDTSKYIIVTDIGTYITIKDHLLKYQGIVYICIIIWVIASISILTLLLLLRVNSRKQEIGILLAIGISKSSIVIQLFLEAAIINIITYAFSISVSGLFASKFSVFLFSEVKGYKTTSMNNFIYLYIFLAINLFIFLSVICSSFKIIKYEPKKILSDLS